MSLSRRSHATPGPQLSTLLAAVLSANPVVARRSGGVNRLQPNINLAGEGARGQLPEERREGTARLCLGLTPFVFPSPFG